MIDPTSPRETRASSCLRRFLSASCIGLVVALSACGGGGDGSAGDTGNSTNPPPPAETVAIVAQPTDQSVTSGQSVSFSVGITGHAAFQWQREVGGQWQPIDGATSTAYTAANVSSVDDNARFRVQITTATGAVLTSSIVALHVTAAPVAPAITLQPSDVTVTVGQPVTLSVTATGTGISYQWQRSVAGSAFTDIGAATSATLSLPEVSLADDGMSLRVIVSNALGSVTSTPAHLAVDPAPAAPTFTTSPANASTVAGSTAVFTVVATGVPVPTLAWQTSRDGATWTPLAGEVSPMLTLTGVTLSSDGIHVRAVATNASGSVPSTEAVLTVSPAPVPAFVTTSPSDISVGVGATPSFHAVAGGYPTPTYQWQVSSDAGITYVNATGATAPDFTLPPVVLGDNGKRVRCVVQNATGHANSAAAVLTVRTPPQITLHPESQAWRPGLPSPQFHVAAAGTGLSYRWQISAAGGAWSELSGATTSDIQVSPPSADAVVRAIVTNAAGDSSVSDAATLSYLRWAYTKLPTGDTMRALQWLDATTLVAVGDNGTIVRSTDAGLTWTTVREADIGHAKQLKGVAFGDATTGIAVGVEGTMLRTTDGGLHWQRVTEGVTAGLTYTAVAFVDATTVVASGSNAPTSTMLRSTDAGATWHTVPVDDLSGQIVESIAFRKGVGIALTYEGWIYRTINGGAQWTRVYTAPYAGWNSVAFGTDTSILAAGDIRAVRSEDGGLTWSDASIAQRFTLLSFVDPTHAIALAAGSGQDEQLSSDGGQTWVSSSAWKGDLTDSTPKAVTALAARGGVLVATAENGTLRRSTDAGVSWTDVGQTPTGDTAGITGLSFGSPSVGIALVGGGLRRTTDGGAHWQAVGGEVDTGSTVWRDASFADATTVYAVDAANRIARSTDGGASWSVRGSLGGAAPSFGYRIAFTPAGLGVAVSDNGASYSIDGGATWHASASGPLTCLGGVQFVDAHTAVTVACWGDVFRSSDGGQTWQDIATDDAHQIVNARFSPDGLHGIAFGRYRSLKRTADGGNTWQSVTLGDFSSSTLDTAWFTSSLEGFVTGAMDGIWHTRDGGATWSLEQAFRLDGMNGQNGNLAAGVALDASTSLVAGGNGVMMIRIDPSTGPADRTTQAQALAPTPKRRPGR